MEQRSNADVTRMLRAIDAGDQAAIGELLSVVYGELKQLADARLSRENSEHSLQPTDLVQETYLRLFGNQTPSFENRLHFFGAASEAMRRVLIERARRRHSKRRGGPMQRLAVDLDQFSNEEFDARLIDLNDAVTRLEAVDAVKARLVKLRFFGGLTIRESAELLDISTATADRHWRFARAWIHREMNAE